MKEEKTKHPKRRNISNRNLMEIYEFIKNFNPNNLKEERDLKILKYAYIDNLSSRSIKELNDPLLVSHSRNCTGKPMTESAIRQVLKHYNLEHEKRIDYSKRNNYQRRKIINKELQSSSRPKICATCGATIKLELHHIIPIYLGGTDDYYNLIYLCHECHMQMHLLIEKIFQTTYTGERLNTNINKSCINNLDFENNKI